MTVRSSVPKTGARAQLTDKVRLCREGRLSVTQPVVPHDAGTSGEARGLSGKTEKETSPADTM